MTLMRNKKRYACGVNGPKWGHLYINDVSKYDRDVQQKLFVNGNIDVTLILKIYV
jgi:hypothetical protein